MVALITGTTGFVGRVWVDCLVANGEHVLAGVRKESSNFPACVPR